MHQAIRGSQLYHGGNNIIARLSAIYMVIGMDAPVPAFAALEFTRPIRDHLVGVHVCGGARPSLENVEDELAIPLSIADLLSGRGDAIGQIRREQPQFKICLRGMLFDKPERPEEFPRKTQPT